MAGIVQGVAFRASTAAVAQRLGLAGWVRNLVDGRVELEAEGPAGVVAQLLAWCAHGPPAARVDGVEVEERAPTGAEATFAVRR